MCTTERHFSLLRCDWSVSARLLDYSFLIAVIGTFRCAFDVEFRRRRADGVYKRILKPLFASSKHFTIYRFTMIPPQHVTTTSDSLQLYSKSSIQYCAKFIQSSITQHNALCSRRCCCCSSCCDECHIQFNPPPIKNTPSAMHAASS